MRKKRIEFFPCMNKNRFEFRMFLSLNKNSVTEK